MPLCSQGTQIRLSNEQNMLPAITSVINMANCDEKKNFVIYTSMKEELPDTYESMEQEKEDIIDMDLSSVDSNSNNRKDDSEKQPLNRYLYRTKLLHMSKFLNTRITLQ